VAEEGGPWVQVAAFCRKVQEGPAGWQPTDLIDRVPLDPAVTGRFAEGRPSPVALVLALSLVAGSIRGSGRVRVECVLPGGRREPGPTEKLSFDTDRSVVRLALPVVLRIEREGVYWFNLYYRDRLLSRLPLLVVSESGATGLPIARGITNRGQPPKRRQGKVSPKRPT
jgi:hypothetical protein